MELIQLKNQLSAEKQKPKRQRDNKLITDLHEQINQQKTILKKGFQDRREQKLTESVKKKQVLDAKKSAQYKKIKAEKLAEAEKQKAKTATKASKKK